MAGANLHPGQVVAILKTLKLKKFSKNHSEMIFHSNLLQLLVLRHIYPRCLHNPFLYTQLKTNFKNKLNIIYNNTDKIFIRIHNHHHHHHT